MVLNGSGSTQSGEYTGKIRSSPKVRSGCDRTKLDCT
jgi:hypothetical protein